MCYSGNCPHEMWSGECGKPRHGVCPDMYEDDDAYDEAQTNAAEYADLAAESQWEIQQEILNRR
jgi:hypothetical protein